MAKRDLKQLCAIAGWYLPNTLVTSPVCMCVAVIGTSVSMIIHMLSELRPLPRRAIRAVYELKARHDRVP